MAAVRRSNTGDDIKVIVSVADDQVDRLQDVGKGLENLGLKISEYLEAVGAIIGTIDAAKLPMLQSAKGVAFVEQSRDIQIAPPDSEVQ
jgi:hypothetical protein